LELVVCLNATQLELLDDVANLFEAVDVFVADGIVVADNQEGTAFKQNNFICIDCFAKHC
jgi:hypothetical protein